MSKERDEAFETWWDDEDNFFVSGRMLKKDAKAIWDAAFKEGGYQPWWSVTREQLHVLFNEYGLTKK